MCPYPCCGSESEPCWNHGGDPSAKVSGSVIIDIIFFIFYVRGTSSIFSAAGGSFSGHFPLCSTIV